MGLLSLLKAKTSGEDDDDEVVSSMIMEDLLHPDTIQLQVTVMIILISLAATLRFLSKKRLQALQGEHTLDLSALNDSSLYKEVFIAYLNAAILEPVLTIGGSETLKSSELIINILTLISICWWIWIITDAFDFTDVMQYYKFHVDLQEEFDADPKRFPWLRLKGLDGDVERSTLVGSYHRDIALWFLLACIAAACLPGVVTHRDVLHAYVICIAWALLHHSCRKATGSWTSSGYLTTFLFPSSAMMPLEYCLPLMDVADTVEDLEFVESYREFVQQRTGVELTIES